MFNNQMSYGVNPYQMGGPQYAAPPQARMTQPLTSEQIKALRANAPAFTLEVSQEDMLRAQCTHKADGKFALIRNNDTENTVTCSICGEKFSLIESAPETVEEATRLITDILQTVKTFYLDMPDQVALNFFQMIPFIERIPKLYHIALENFNRYENTGMSNPSPNMYGFNMLGAITNPQAAYGFGGFQQQPFAQQPFYQQQPVGGNPFGTYGNQYGTVPQQPQYQPQPQYQQPPVTMQQEAPQQADPSGVVQTKVFNV